MLKNAKICLFANLGLTFFKMTEMYFEDSIDDTKYLGHLYGLGTNHGNREERGLSLSPTLIDNAIKE